MRISELAKKAGCTVESIRFYENHDLIPRPPRTESNYRVYGPAIFPVCSLFDTADLWISL